MGLFDKLKNYITGGDVAVSLEIPTAAMPGRPLTCKVTAIANSAVESKGVYIDVNAVEEVNLGHTTNGLQLSFSSGPAPAQADRIQESRYDTYTNAFLIHPAFSMKEGETKEFTGTIPLPRELQPTYKGRNARHTIHVRARISASGNDPDSGDVELLVGAEV